MSDAVKRTVVNLENFGQLRRGLGSGAGTQALRGIRELATTTLTRGLARMMEKVDDALFARAEKAGNNMSQTQYFDAMRELRIIRRDIEEDFIARFHEQFNQGVPRASQFSSGFSLNWEDDDASGPGLVDKNDMEEDLAVSNMVNKTRGNCKQSLYSLDKRIGLLINDPDLERWLNPLGPEAICEAFHQATRLIETGLEIRLVIFKLFDQHVISNIGDLYKELNQYLARMGVLPEIKTTLRKSSGPRNGAQTAPTAMEKQPAGGTADKIRSMSTSGPAVDSGPAGYSLAAGDGQAVSAQSPIHALTFLQQGELPQGELAVESADLTSGQVNILHGIKQSSLMRDIGKGGDMTIDIVAMLFDYILDDQNIPDSMRALIGRLQIPLLKIALLDREFFSRKSHPARQLLNRLAATAVGWDEQQGDKDPLYLMVQSIVQTIVEEFDDDVSLFETLLNDLETFLHKEEEQASARAERSAKVMEGQERLEVAKTSTLEEIAPHVNDQQNLGFIRDFLSTHWKNLLVVTCARQGKDSEAWKQAVTTMDDLIWSVKPKFTREDRQQLVAMQSKLLNNLREGMERLGMPSTERDDFIAKLVHAHGRTAVNNKDASETVETPADSNSNSDSDNNNAVSDAVESPPVSVGAGAEKEAEQADTGTLVEIDDAHTERARQLATGDWMEFPGSDGNTQRAKLSWISPITNTYLFTDRQGLKAGNFSLQELAHLLRCARAHVLDAAPLMDRAVSTVFKEYQKH